MAEKTEDFEKEKVESDTLLSHSIVIFTDGSSRGNPGPGGYAAIIIAPKSNELGSKNYEVKEIGGREKHTTNNRMELTAAIEALSFIHKSKIIHPKSILVYSDSSYVINGITKWIHGWQKNNWKTKAKQDVENRDLWEKLVDVTRGKEIEWKLVEGHAGVAGNVRCDEIATAFADSEKSKLYSGVLENYGIKDILDIAEDAGARDEKRETRQRQNAKAYSYVSMVNGVIQTHKTWKECEQKVKGVRGAKYKKALSAEDEKGIIASWS